jgi:uncharacterized protein (DUF302 family)
MNTGVRNGKICNPDRAVREVIVNYYISRYVDYGFEEAISRVTEALGKEGFGILTKIDVTATMKAKLDVNFRPYVILGACNPPFAHQALDIDDKIGVLLPCNVVVQEHENGRVEVVAMDPKSVMQGSPMHDLSRIADDVQMKLRTVLAAL